MEDYTIMSCDGKDSFVFQKFFIIFSQLAAQLCMNKLHLDGFLFHLQTALKFDVTALKFDVIFSVHFSFYFTFTSVFLIWSIDHAVENIICSLTPFSLRGN